MLIGIVGGGLSGISLQYFLKKDSEVLEREDRSGGLCRTLHKDGFCYDIGGHILFSRERYITDFIKTLLAPDIICRRRNNKILFKDRFIKYPFENGLGLLDKQDIYECLMGYLINRYPRPVNFREWIYYTFGDGIAERYLIPYNEKIWKFRLKDMGMGWVERVPRPPLEDVVRSALGIETEGYPEQLYFYYPARGGIEGLVKALIKEKARITTGFEVKKIQKKGKRWFVTDGNKDRYYDKLVLTLPLKEAVRYMDDVPHKVLKAAEALKYNSLRVVFIGIGNESLLDKSAVYIPLHDIPAHRVCYPGYFSKNNVPEGKSSLVAEITAPPGHELYRISNIKLIKKVADGLARIGLIKKKDIITTDTKFFEYGYVVYDLRYQKNIKIVRNYFSDIGVELHGRFAEFEYLNMDEVIRRSINLSKKL